ncbi:Hpt domain-containing protein [Psychrosphaera sp. 1_MG-2023]|uniref:Hpt domain-containing protein n=1 Tax=Psychrosphaera sp. 1_MG-2023 TaxID=3062643 RepID=UPI0026E237C8|nr:Hpt domain-containing protein [Psychrosphaera sp. 1_MG-2023]MDO6721155.1 Hpt domain-containing protein [Psychrosphaera sp. 1_MG-2023]
MAIDGISQIDGFDTGLGIKNCMDDESLYLSIVGMYVTQLKQNVIDLQAQFDLSDWESYGKTCHSIKGASASVGAVKIQQESSVLEAAGKNSDELTISDLHNEFLQLLSTTYEALESL